VRYSDQDVDVFWREVMVVLAISAILIFMIFSSVTMAWKIGMCIGDLCSPGIAALIFRHHSKLDGLSKFSKLFLAIIACVVVFNTFIFHSLWLVALSIILVSFWNGIKRRSWKESKNKDLLADTPTHMSSEMLTQLTLPEPAGELSRVESFDKVFADLVISK
jgi:hypothetical protein